MPNFERPQVPAMEREMSEKEILTDRIADIDARLAELTIELANRPQDHSYQRQELQSEKNSLTTARRVSERALGDLTAPPPKPNERREKFIAAEVQTRREQTLAFIQNLERAGDHRQARIWRQELLTLRQQVEREFPA